MNFLITHQLMSVHITFNLPLPHSRPLKRWRLLQPLNMNTEQEATIAAVRPQAVHCWKDSREGHASIHPRTANALRSMSSLLSTFQSVSHKEPIAKILMTIFIQMT